ncbi:TIGR04086 family membrane protein [Clostridium sp. CT7]|nr:TIGR04086 family membrane protein [Clostridium sp. CT7]
MERKSKIYVSAAGGVLRALFITLVVILIFAFVSTKVSFSEGITNMVILVTTLLSVMFGSIYSSRKSGQKGWLNGLLVGIFYIAIFYIVSLIDGSSGTFQLRDIIRIVLAIVVGTLSGMLGINI